MSLLALLFTASAALPVEQAQMAELDRVRAQYANEIHLAAFDLIDELVHGWTQDPVFEEPVPVVVAGITVPVGLGTGMQALMENHLASVLLQNPTSNVVLAHCPVCTAVTVHSGPEGTIVSRGIDNPDVLEQLGAGTGKHALFIDVEAEGAWLVLRARITKLTPDLPIVWSHTIATSTSTPALLRASRGLKSADEARKEYLDALRDRGPLAVPVRIGVRTYARPDDSSRIAPPPFLWVQTGLEMGTRNRAWASSIVVGYSLIPNAYQGILAQARISRLLTGRVRSHTRPDLYAFVGAAAITVWGPQTGSFSKDTLTADDLIRSLDQDPPRATFGALHLGLDLRVGNRIGISSFLETMPDFQRSQNMGGYLQVGLKFQTFGTEVSFWF